MVHPGPCVSLWQPLALEVGTHSCLPPCSSDTVTLMDKGLHCPLRLWESRLSYPPLHGPPCSSQSRFLSVAGLILSPAVCHPLVPATLMCSLRMQTTGKCLSSRQPDGLWEPRPASYNVVLPQPCGLHQNKSKQKAWTWAKGADGTAW